MSVQSTALTLRFRHPERTDAPDGPDSPCAQADAGDVSVTGGDLSYIDSDGRLQGAPGRERSVSVQIATNLFGDRASQSVARDSNSLTHQMTIHFGPSDPRFESLCAEWIDGVCWHAAPITWPNLNVTAFEHEGEGYELDDIYPIIPVSVSDDGAEFAQDITLSISWPRGDLRRFITPNTYAANITWRPFNPDPVPEHWVAGPHFPGDVEAGGQDLGWKIDLDFEFAGEQDTLRYAYRVPVKFVLRSEGRDFDLGPDADFTSKDDAWQPKSIDGGMVILNSGDMEDGEPGALSPALEVTPELFEYAYADGWEGSEGYIDMLLYKAWGHCEFTLHGRCPDPDYEPGDDDVTITTPWTSETLTPEHAGTQIVTNPRASGMTRSQSSMDSDEEGRVSVAVVQPVVWWCSRWYYEGFDSTYPGESETLVTWLSTDTAAMASYDVTRTGVFGMEFGANYPGVIVYPAPDNEDEPYTLAITNVYTQLTAPRDRSIRITAEAFSASGGDSTPVRDWWVVEWQVYVNRPIIPEAYAVVGIDRGGERLNSQLLGLWYRPRITNDEERDDDDYHLPTQSEVIVPANTTVYPFIYLRNNPEVKVKFKVEYIDPE